MMWQNFQTFLNTYPYKETEVEEMLHAANDTFLHFKHWVKKTLY